MITRLSAWIAKKRRESYARWLRRVAAAARMGGENLPPHPRPFRSKGW